MLELEGWLVVAFIIGYTFYQEYNNVKVVATQLFWKLVWAAEMLVMAPVINFTSEIKALLCEIPRRTIYSTALILHLYANLTKWWKKVRMVVRAETLLVILSFFDALFLTRLALWFVPELYQRTWSLIKCVGGHTFSEPAGRERSRNRRGASNERMRRRTESAPSSYKSRYSGDTNMSTLTGHCTSSPMGSRGTDCENLEQPAVMEENIVDAVDSVCEQKSTTNNTATCKESKGVEVTITEMRDDTLHTEPAKSHQENVGNVINEIRQTVTIGKSDILFMARQFEEVARKQRFTSRDKPIKEPDTYWLKK